MPTNVIPLPASDNSSASRPLSEVGQLKLTSVCFSTPSMKKMHVRSYFWALCRTRDNRRSTTQVPPDANTPYGVIEDLLVHAYEFDRDMIAGLVDEGLATARREIIAASDRTTIEVARIMISNAGRSALEG